MSFSPLQRTGAPAGGGRGAVAQAPPSPARAPAPRSSSWDWPRVRQFLLNQHLPIGLIIAVVFGFLVPEPGIVVGHTPVNTISICGIFFISGLNLQTDEVKQALRAYKSIAFGMVSILFLSPLLSLVIAELPLDPHEYSQGLALFACMPTTVSSGVLMTSVAKGNVALALFFSVTTNLVGVLTVPFFLSRILQTSDGSSAIDPLSLLWKLALTILLPLLVGKALRWFTRVVDFAKRYKQKLKYVSSALLISVPWITMSQSASRLKQTTAASFFVVAALGCAVHAILLVFNYAASRLLRLPLPEKKAVVINASQKTVNTAMSVIQFLPEDVADRGLLMLPCIISHFVQTIMDAVIVSQWKKYTDAPTHPTATTTNGNTGGDGKGIEQVVGAPTHASGPEPYPDTAGLASTADLEIDDTPISSEGTPPAKFSFPS